jgi:hypothetical protein
MTEERDERVLGSVNSRLLDGSSSNGNPRKIGQCDVNMDIIADSEEKRSAALMQEFKDECKIPNLVASA